MTQFASTLYPRTNPSNPILLWARECEPGVERDSFIARVMSSVPTGNNGFVPHAQKVLSRLANLTG